MLGHTPHQRQRIRRRGQHKLLPLLQTKADLDRHLSKAVELLVKSKGGKGVGRCRGAQKLA